MARIKTSIVVGEREVATENRWLHGPVEGRWWTRFSWWVVPLGVFLLVWPGWLHMGIRVLAGAATTSPTVVVPAPAPVINVTVTPPAPPAPAPIPTPKPALTPRPTVQAPRPQQQVAPTPTPVPTPAKRYFDFR